MYSNQNLQYGIKLSGVLMPLHTVLPVVKFPVSQGVTQIPTGDIMSPTVLW